MQVIVHVYTMYVHACKYIASFPGLPNTHSWKCAALSPGSPLLACAIERMTLNTREWEGHMFNCARKECTVEYIFVYTTFRCLAYVPLAFHVLHIQQQKVQLHETHCTIIIWLMLVSWSTYIYVVLCTRKSGEPTIYCNTTCTTLFPFSLS